MTSEELLQKMIRVMRQTSLPVFIAEVKKVKGNVCTVVFPDGFELEGVRLKAAIDEKEEFVLITPKIGSTVLLGSLSQSESDGDFYVIACNEVASITGVIDKTKFSIDKTKVSASVQESSFSLKDGEVVIKQKDAEVSLKAENIKIKSKEKIIIASQGESLKTILKELVDALKNVQVLTGSPGSPSPILPALIPTITAIGTKIENLFDLE